MGESRGTLIAERQRYIATSAAAIMDGLKANQSGYQQEAFVRRAFGLFMHNKEFQCNETD